jgi:hypothetical protein
MPKRGQRTDPDLGDRRLLGAALHDDGCLGFAHLLLLRLGEAHVGLPLLGCLRLPSMVSYNALVSRVDPEWGASEVVVTVPLWSCVGMSQSMSGLYGGRARMQRRL